MLGKAGISPKEKQKDAVYDDSDGCVAIQHKAFLFNPILSIFDYNFGLAT